MSGYSKVTVNKVKKTLKAAGVSMRMTPVRLRKLASFMTHFLFVVYLSSARTNLSEPIFRQVKPQNLCYQLNDPLSSVVIARLPIDALLVEGVCLHLLPPGLPPCVTLTPSYLLHCYPCLHDMGYHTHALL